MTIPLPILEFAKLDALPGHDYASPIAWRETADEWIIVYQDGRKLRHKKTDEHPANIGDMPRTKQSRTARKQERHT